MKKLLTLLFALVAITAGAVEYNLYINKTQVTSDNAGDLSVIDGVTGTVTYDAATKTLTLQNASIVTEGDFAYGIDNNTDGLTIKLVGNNKIQTNGSYRCNALYFSQSATITGPGSLRADSPSWSACLVSTRKTLTIDGGAQVTMIGYYSGLEGYSGGAYLVMNGRTTKLTARNMAADSQFYGSLEEMLPTLNDGLGISAPDGARFNSRGTVVNANGSVIGNEDVVISYIGYDLWVNGTQVTRANADDLSVIDGVTGTVNYNATTNTLTLQDATITTDQNVSNIRNEIEGLKVNVVGNNTLGVTSGAANSIQAEKPMTITGTGALTANATGGSGCYTSERLTIQNGVQAKFTGSYGISCFALSNTTKLVVSGAQTRVTANGTMGSMKYTRALLNDGLAITQPVGAMFSSDGSVVDVNGALIKNQDVVISKPEIYNLWINAMQVTSANASNLSSLAGVTGTVTYDAGSKTLTLNNATITAETTNILSRIEGLTIDVVGTNTLSVTSDNYSSLSAQQSLTITGTGTLNASAVGGSGCYVNDQATLTIEGGVDAHFTGTYGIFGFGSTAAPKLIMSGADTRLTANGTTCCITHMPPTLNDGLGITQPVGAWFNDVGTVVDNDGNFIRRQDVVISYSLRGFKRGGLWYEKSGSSAVMLIAPQQGDNYSGNVVIPSAFNYDGQVWEVRAIEANAFTGTSVTSVEVPATVKTIGEKAFYAATSLKTLIFATEAAPNKLTLGDQFVGNNASDFKFYVFNSTLLAWTLRYSYNFLPWVQTKDNGFLTFACALSVTLPDGLKAYRVTGFDSDTRMATATRLTSSAIPSRNGLVLQGQPSTRYLLQAASSAPAVGDNMLLPLLELEDIPYEPFAAHPDDSKIYFLGGNCEQWKVFANSIDLFMVLQTGVSYLAVDKTLLGDDYTSAVQLDLWSNPHVYGDVNGDGSVDVSDVNMVINMMLGNTSPTPEGDVSGNGDVDVSDVNIIINIMLGKI